jgi:hypothetical protein
MTEQETKDDALLIPGSTEVDTAVGTEGDGLSGSTGQGGAGRRIESPLERFFVVELGTEGFSANISVLDEHIRSAFYRMDPEQRAKVDYQKVRFYRTCAKLASFKLDKQYVIPRDRLNLLEDEYKKIQIAFEGAKNEIYRDLTLRWKDIVDAIYKKHPTFPIPPDRMDELRPSSPNFLTMNYQVRSLIAVLNEMKGLKEVLSSSDLNPDIADRVEKQRQLLASKIRFEYEGKISKLNETIDRLKGIAKKKGKRYEKLSLQALDTKKDIEEMAEIVGEKDMLRTRLEGMLEFLAENVVANDKAQQREQQGEPQKEARQ